VEKLFEKSFSTAPPLQKLFKQKTSFGGLHFNPKIRTKVLNKGFYMRYYLCIDLKSFYASVECVERGLDPMEAKLVVCDPDRGKGTICLAVSPALKTMGVKNRCRVFEIPEGIEYIKAVPRMRLYMEYSARIYGVYLRYISKDDIHIYSCDEVFIDATQYMRIYKMTARELGKFLMNEVFEKVGVRAACGVGTNLYLAKIALDITAKKSPDFIGELDEEGYIRTLWNHEPITDFWQIGKGKAARLAHMGIFTMKDIAETPEDYLYRVFGIDAELLIDHAWGREICTIEDIKKARPKTQSLTSGQVLLRDYNFDEARIITTEMTENLCMELMTIGAVCRSITVTMMYSHNIAEEPAHGTVKFRIPTNLCRESVCGVLEMYDKKVIKHLPIRRIMLSANDIVSETDANSEVDMFDCDDRNREHNLQAAMLCIRNKWGKNSLLKGTNMLECATQIMRNAQVGGHKG